MLKCGSDGADCVEDGFDILTEIFLYLRVGS